MKKNTKSAVRALAAVLAAALTLTACSPGTNEVVYSETRAFALDTLIDLKIYHFENESIDESILPDSVKLIGTLENTLSSHIQGTDVDRINANAGQSVSVSPITYQTIQNSIAFSRITGGLFDVSAGPLIDLWAIDPPDGHLPSQAELADTLPLIDYRDIDLSKANTVRLAKPDMKINLGAIAKGTIADAVKEKMLEKGAVSALINLGGNVLMVGGKPDGTDFVIGVQDPADSRGAYLLSISGKDIAIVSSGDYERYFEKDGVRYHHILNPKTGYPADSNIAQVTIVAPTGERADGLSTSVLLLGLKDGVELVASLADVEAVFITKTGRIYITPHLRDQVTIDWQQSEGYTYVDTPDQLD